jgi:beta-glucosidase
VAEAEKRAKEADLNIVVAGEYMMRFRWTDRTDGEDTDRSDLDLVGLQNELIRKVAASGKPTILILVNGRPLGVEWAAEHLPAIVEAWAPGMYAGQAVAEILYGKVNPSAKLAITIPRSVGQLQMIYNHKPSQYFHPYAVKPSTPLWPFGYGLSYTTYKYDDLKPYIQRMMEGEANILWNTPITWFAKSSGTTDKSKYIPVSKEFLDGCHYNGGRDMITFQCINNADTKLL